MTFLYPLGLLGLLGIPVLILIYIIKSKYTEQTVSSTYLWHLSERFLKKRNPFSHLTGLISLILQILAVIAISLTIAHPILTMPGAAQDYCFVLDGTGSMQMQHGEDVTRFEAGKQEIAKIIEDSADGSTYTLIYIADKTTKVYEQTDSKEVANALLEELKYSFSDTTLADAQAIAQAKCAARCAARPFYCIVCSSRAFQDISSTSTVSSSSRRKPFYTADVKNVPRSAKEDCIDEKDHSNALRRNAAVYRLLYPANQRRG